MIDDALSNRIGFALRQAQHRLRIFCDDALRAIGLTTPQFAVLKVLAIMPESSGAELARASLLTPQTMHAIMRTLESRGFMVRNRNHEDGRATKISLTPEGVQMLEQADAIIAKVEAAFTSALSIADVEHLRQMLVLCVEQNEA